jgi:hypothetical protein
VALLTLNVWASVCSVGMVVPTAYWPEAMRPRMTDANCRCSGVDRRVSTLFTRILLCTNKISDPSKISSAAVIKPK